MICDERAKIRSFCVLHRKLMRDVFFYKGEESMENRIAILGIIVQDRDSSSAVNQLLYEYGDCIIGRMGIPHHGRYSIITIVMDCPNDTINALSGKLGRLKNVQVKSMMAK